VPKRQSRQTKRLRVSGLRRVHNPGVRLRTDDEDQDSMDHRYTYRRRKSFASLWIIVLAIALVTLSGYLIAA
jgi:hypothetical protein